MRPHPDGVPGIAIVGAAGAAWGLGLARFLAETLLWPPLYSSVLVVGAVALGCAAVLVAVHRWVPFVPCSSSLLNHWWVAMPLGLSLLYVTGIVAGPLAGGVLLTGGVLLAVLVSWQHRPAWLLPALLGLIAFGIYLRTLLPGVGEADVLEFQVVASKLGIAHPTGYPLYILLTKLFTFLPLNNVAWRVNLASAVFATGAVLMAYAVVRDLTDRPVISFLTVLSFAFSSVFWSQALIAEVYTLHNLFVAVLFWFLLRRPGVSERGVNKEARRWQVALFLLGLSLTNHLTTLLLTPAVGLALLWDRPRLRAREWLVACGLFVLGLSANLFILLRWPALHNGRWMSLGDFFTYISGGQFHDALRLDGWQDPSRWETVGRLVREPFGWIGVGLAALGVIDLVARRRRVLALTGTSFLAFFVYGLCYYVADIAVFLLPAHLILGVWMGLGIALLARFLASVPSRPAAICRSGLVALFALMPLSRVWINLPRVDRSRDGGGCTWSRSVLAQPLASKGAILADTKKFAPLYYLQQVEGMRSDLDIVLLGTEELYQADLRRRLDRGQTVYLARFLPNLDGFHLQSVGPLVEVQAGFPEGKAVSGHVIANFGEGIQLLSAEINEDSMPRGMYHLTLRWRTREAVATDLEVRVRLVDADGHVQWTSEGSRPVNGLYPTNAWPVDVPVSDYHELVIPPWVPPGTYRLEVGLFFPLSSEGLIVDEDGTPWLKVDSLDVKAPPDSEPLSDPVLYSFGDRVWLTGVAAPGESSVDSEAVIDIAWRHVDERERIRLSWINSEGKQRGIDVFPLSAGMARSRHAIRTPGEAGAYTLQVGVADGAARCGWLAPPRDSCPLAEVSVLAGAAGLADFGTRLVLMDAEVGRTTANPGALIPVNLRWRGLRSIDEDYTVFVHLVGPDGRLHGQVDSWPVQGSYPTSLWTPGREVTDRYEVRLDADAPVGHYRVEVGLYLLETMQRLRVIDDEGQPVADSFVAGTFRVGD